MLTKSSDESTKSSKLAKTEFWQSTLKFVGMKLSGTCHRAPIQYDVKRSTEISHSPFTYVSEIFQTCFMLATVLGTGQI